MGRQGNSIHGRFALLAPTSNLQFKDIVDRNELVIVFVATGLQACEISQAWRPVATKSRTVPPQLTIPHMGYPAADDFFPGMKSHRCHNRGSAEQLPRVAVPRFTSAAAGVVRLRIVSP